MAILDNPATRIATSVVVAGILFGIVFLLMPVYEMPEGLITAIDWLFDTLWGFDFMIPVITLMTCFGLVILVDIIFAGIKLVLFFKKHLTKSQ